MAMSRSARLLAKMLAVVLRAVPGVVVCSSLAAPARAQVSLFDPRFDEIRKASVAWDRRTGPARKVVDVVCLVPDVPTFFEAIAKWDEHHYFPVLLDDVEYTFKFLRAFRPARIVRYPKRSAPLATSALWDQAIASVGKSWASDAAPLDDVPRGNLVPRLLGSVPPGVVLSSPESPALAGAVALAAGRFQPLLRWQTQRHFDDLLGLVEARALALSLETVIAGQVPKYDQLGDDCDFVTLGGDYPYRYEENAQHNAFDDLILRSVRGQKRWAFSGRLTGDATTSVYRAMCSLFLRPSSALLWNGYSDKDAPWAEYAMATPAARLGQLFEVTHKVGDQANLSGWHQTLDPVNRFGLLLINSSGEPTYFNLPNGPGHAADIPESVPSAVLMIHSFSAAIPNDSRSVAGRWLANGAFAFFGSMNEPFLNAFRTPQLVGEFLGENLPLVASVRRSSVEFFGQPWRLVYLGDPLYRIKTPVAATPRLAAWDVLESWPVYGEFLQPPLESAESVRLNWVLKTAIFRFQVGVTPRQTTDLAATLLGIARERLDARLQPLYDELLTDTLMEANRLPELIDRLGRVPPEQRTAASRRHVETCQTAVLQRAVDARDPSLAVSLWNDVVRAAGSHDFVKVFTQRVGSLATGPSQLAEWRTRLVAAQHDAAERSNSAVIEAELKRVEDRLEKVREAKD